MAAAPLAVWVKANLAYSKVLEKVAPLEQELNGLQVGVGSVNQSHKGTQRHNCEM